MIIHPYGKRTRADQVKSQLSTPVMVVKKNLEAFRDKIDPYAAVSKEQRSMRVTTQGARRTRHRKLHLYEVLGSAALEASTDGTPLKGRLLVLDVESRERPSGARKVTVYTRYWLINKTGTPRLPPPPLDGSPPLHLLGPPADPLFAARVGCAGVDVSQGSTWGTA